MNNTYTEDSYSGISVDRELLCHFHNIESPTIVFFAGIHGNEPAGIKAIEKVKSYIEREALSLKGNMYAFAGNLTALKQNERFLDSDLNRMWTGERLNKLHDKNEQLNSEQREQLELYKKVKEVLKQHQQQIIFIDLHTTSSETIPFITISDSINNRRFTADFTLPVILGIEEYLEGPLLTYINEFGHISLGFEAGQHYSEESVLNCEAFIWLSLVKSGIIDTAPFSLDYFKKLLKKRAATSGFYEIDYLHSIQKNESFKMLNGFKNFEKIKKHVPLALSNEKTIIAPRSGFIFMPLYQKQGEEGFFIISKISEFWLQLSTLVRKLKLDNLLSLLLGVKKHPDKKYVLIVNTNTARLLTNEVFHLFGYRKKVKKEGKIYFIKRDRGISEFN